jgi:hypothetical protein
MLLDTAFTTSVRSNSCNEEQLMREPINQPTPTNGRADAVLGFLFGSNSHRGRIGSATVPFGLVGPKVDIVGFLDRRRERATITGSEEAERTLPSWDCTHEPAEERYRNTVDLPDCTRIPFIAAADLLDTDEARW